MVCQLFPTLRTNELEDIINYHNSQLVEWGTDNGITIMKCELSLKLATGEVDEMCFHMNNENPGIFLNTCGVIRLFDSLNKQCQYLKLCDDWKKMKISHEWTNTQLEPTIPQQRKNRRPSIFGRRPTSERGQDQRTALNGGQPRNNKHQQADSRNYKRRYNEEGLRDERNQRYQHRPAGCYNCGEFNHRQGQCRYDHRIKCNIGYRLEHKGRICSSYVQ